LLLHGGHEPPFQYRAPYIDLTVGTGLEIFRVVMAGSAETTSENSVI
jgi:hypothetical protein